MCYIPLCTNGHRCHKVICNYYTISVQHRQIISKRSVRQLVAVANSYQHWRTRPGAFSGGTSLSASQAIVCFLFRDPLFLYFFQFVITSLACLLLPIGNQLLQPHDFFWGNMLACIINNATNPWSIPIRVSMDMWIAAQRIHHTTKMIIMKQIFKNWRSISMKTKLT